MTKRDGIQLSPRISGNDGSSTSSSSCKVGAVLDPPYRKVLRAAVVALLFLTPLIFPWRIEYKGAITYRFSSFLVPKEAFVQFVVVLAVCYWLIAMLRGGALRLRSNPFLLPVAVFITLAGISALYSPTSYSSAIDFAKMLTLIIFFLIVLNSFLDEKDVRLALRVIFVSGLVVATLSLLQLAGTSSALPRNIRYPMKPIFRLSQGVAQLFPHYPGNPQRMYSTFGNDSGVAGYLLPVLPAGTGLFLTSGSSWSKRIYFVGLLVIAYTIMACHTRGVWLAAFVALVFLFVNVVRHHDLRAILGAHRVYVMVALVALIVFLLIQSIAPGTSSGETDTLTRAKSAFISAQPGVNLRGVFWGAALLMAGDRPVFGFGLGTYKYYVQRYQGRLMAALGPMSRLQPNELDTGTAHNDYVQLASELGGIGIAVLGWGLFVIWRCVRHTFSSRMDAGSRCIFLSSLSGVLGVAVFAVTNFPFHIVTHALVFMFLLATVIGSGDAERAVYKKWRAPNNPVSRAALSLCVILLGATFLCLVIRPYVADYHEASASVMESAEPHAEAALEELKKAVHAEPRNGRIRAHLGRAYLLRGMIHEARTEFARALEDYDSAWVHIDLGSACETQDNLDEAIHHYSDAVFRVPRYPMAHELLVRLLIKAGRYEEARKRCEEALRWVGETPELLNALGVVAYRDGDKERCITLLRKSLETKTDQDEVRTFLRRIEKETRKFSRP